MRTVSVKLMADAADFNRNIRGAGANVKSLAGELDKANKAGRLDHVTDMAAGLGIGLLGVAAVGAKFSKQFEKQMSAVKAATHASSGEVEKLRLASLKAGKDTQFSATQAAQGVEELAKAGISTADILGGGLKGALDLAAAGQIDVGDAAETAASALTQFKLKGKDVPHVADLLAAAAGKAQGSVGDMGAALNQAGLVAASTGLTIEDTTGTLAAFANAGLIGSDAGTSFKAMLQMLQAPSGKTKELMDQLGISAYDTAGQFIGITGLAGQLKDKLGQLTPELRANAMAQIFGQDAVRASNILYEQGAEGIQKWIEKTNDAGYAAETAAIKTDNLAGDLERLKGSLETAAIESGGGLNQGLRVLTKSADALVGTIEKLPSGTTAAITVLAALGGALTLGLVAWVKSRAAIAAAVAELNAVGPAGARAAVGLQATTKWAGRAAIAFVGLEVAGAVFDKFGNSAVNVDKLTAALENYATTGKMSKGLTDAFGEDLEFLGKNAKSAEMATQGFWGGWNDFTSSIPGIGSALDSINEWTWGTSMNDSTERMQALDESLTAFIGTQKDAKKAGELWNEVLSKSGLDTEELAGLLPNAWKGLQDLQKASSSGATAQADLAAKTQKSAEEMEKQKAEAEALKKAFDDLFGRYMSADEAAIAYQSTLESTNKELKEGTRTLDLNKEAGRENRKAILDLIKAAKEQRDANIANGMSVEEADKKYRKQIGTLKTNATNLDFNATKVGKLIDKYDGIPGKVDTKVSVTGDKAVMNKLLNLKAYQDALKKGAPVVSIRKQLSKDNADFLKYHDGGRTAQVGEFEEAGVVHGKEFVFNAATVKKIDRQAPGFLDEVHATGRLPGYAGGGRVVWPYPVTAAMTRIPSRQEVMSVVTPPVPTGGRTSDWIVATVRARFPGIDLLSQDRPGARTLSGNVSYHALGRAADFEPSRALAEWWNANYKARTKELITPWNSLNIHNGVRHTYTGAVYRQHNFAGGNAHDHIAMGGGGVINEHVVGVGASGRTYEFGERGIPETVTPGYLPSPGGTGGTVVHNEVNVTVTAPVGSHPVEIGNQVLKVVGAALSAGSELRVRGQKVF